MTLGKVIGGGLPLAAVGGKAIYMDRFAPEGPVYQAGTLAGNPLAVAAGLKTLEILERDNPYPEMAAKCARIAEGVNAAAREHGVPLRVAHFGGVFTMFCSAEPVTDLAGAMRCDTALYAKVFHSLYDREIYIAPSQFECNFVSAAHADADADAFVSAVREIFQAMERFPHLHGRTGIRILSGLTERFPLPLPICRLRRSSPLRMTLCGLRTFHALR